MGHLYSFDEFLAFQESSTMIEEMYDTITGLNIEEMSDNRLTSLLNRLAIAEGNIEDALRLQDGALFEEADTNEFDAKGIMTEAVKMLKNKKIVDFVIDKTKLKSSKHMAVVIKVVDWISKKVNQFGVILNTIFKRIKLVVSGKKNESLSDEVEDSKKGDKDHKKLFSLAAIMMIAMIIGSIGTAIFAGPAAAVAVMFAGFGLMIWANNKDEKAIAKYKERFGNKTPEQVFQQNLEEAKKLVEEYDK